MNGGEVDQCTIRILGIIHIVLHSWARGLVLVVYVKGKAAWHGMNDRVTDTVTSSWEGGKNRRVEEIDDWDFAMYRTSACERSFLCG